MNSSHLDIHCRDDFGRTALHNAILSKEVGMAELLCSEGAELGVHDDRGDSALHTAVRTGDEAVLRVSQANPTLPSLLNFPSDSMQSGARLPESRLA